MKHKTTTVLSALVAILFGLSACAGKNESRGKEVGKKIDKYENNVKKQVEKGKDAAHNAHEKIKEKAHELVDKS